VNAQIFFNFDGEPFGQKSNFSRLAGAPRYLFHAGSSPGPPVTINRSDHSSVDQREGKQSNYFGSFLYGNR
jgi:hypothetical protein